MEDEVEFYVNYMKGDDVETGLRWRWYLFRAGCVILCRCVVAVRISRGLRRLSAMPSKEYRRPYKMLTA